MSKNILKTEYAEKRHAPGYVALLIMLSAFLLIPCQLPLSAQEKTLTLDKEEVGIVELFKMIEEKSDYVFFYKDDLIDKNVRVSGKFRNQTVRQILDKTFSNSDLTYVLNGKQITIVRKSTSDLDSKATEGQRKTLVQGVVYDQDGNPMPGVGVLVKGSNNGTITDVDGRYTLEVPSYNSTIVFSSLGFTPMTLSADDLIKSPNIRMAEDINAIDEVVVVGYSTRTREKLISSVSTINSQSLVKSNVPNLENALSGRVSGVFSRQTSSEPGFDGANLQIRGFGSALIVVDGIPGRSYSNLDPGEIESISVLKDASAAAVYGMQGANGVILVTTKRGQKNRPATIEFSSNFGYQVPYDYPKPAKTSVWQTLVNEYNANLKLINDRNSEITSADFDMREYKFNTDWYKEMLRNAPISQSNISISGGMQKVNYFVSLGYLYQGGIWSTNSTSKNRYNFRANLDADILKNLKMSVGVGAIINNLVYPGASSSEIAREMKKAAPNIPVKWPGYENYYAFRAEGAVNPKALADKDVSGYTKKKSKNVNIDLALEYKVPFVEGLSFKAAMGYTQQDSWNKYWDKEIVYLGYYEDSGEYYESSSASLTDKASLSLLSTYDYSITGQGYVNYLHSFGNHNINSSFIFEFSNISNRSTGSARSQFPSSVLDMMAGGLTGEGVTNSETQRTYRSASYIGRISYDYASKYFVDFNFRYDGAQYFADKWGFFPSASVGWMVTKEPFMEGLKDYINEMKLRFSWGQLGDLSSARSYYSSNEQYYYESGYLYPGTAMSFGDRQLYGLSETLNANPDFTWSRSTMENAGIDFKLFWNLLSGSFDMFYRSRTGLPAKKANDNAGALATYYNLNSDNTRGFELSLTHANSIGDFDYSVTGNLSWSRSKWHHLEHSSYTNGYLEWIGNSEDHWKNVRWGYHYIGRYHSYEEIDNAPMHDNSNNNGAILPGDLKYEDWNGDGYIDGYDRMPIGRSSYPELMYGLTVNMNWKGFDLTMFWQGGARSNFTISYFDMDAFQEGATYNNAWNYFKDRWRKADYTNPSSEWISGHFPAIRDFTSVTINRNVSNFWMWNGNYIRLKNLEIGYTLPQKLTNKISIKQLRMYVSAYNMLTFCSQKFFDPEQASDTYFSFAGYPRTKTYNFGLNIKF